MSLETFRGYDAWKTRTPFDDQQDHRADCPCNEDAPERCICGCDMEGHPEDHCESALARLDFAKRLPDFSDFTLTEAA